MSRATAAMVIVAGGLLMVLPFLDWFTLGSERVSGVAASGAVAALPVVGALIAAIGTWVVRREIPASGGAATGPWLLPAGLLALIIAGIVTWSAPVDLESRLDGVVVRLPAEPRPTIAAWATVAVAGVVLVIGLRASRPGRLLAYWRDGDD